jgi:[ribosomal protein S18]-alanine N-acetyltransferase
MALQDFKIRSAENKDAYALNAFLSFEDTVHRHLDWRAPADWLGCQPYHLLLSKDRLLAALACPPDPPEIAWVRLFAAAQRINTGEAWRLLFEKCQQDLADKATTIIYAAVSLQDWFTNILKDHNFSHYQDIIVLEWQQASPPSRQPMHDLNFRTMTTVDLVSVEIIDRLAFEHLWQIRLNGITAAFQHAAYASVVEKDGAIIAYQITTHTPYSAHLARLAVHPDLQGQRIGQRLVIDLLHYFHQKGIHRITVNTQSDNLASQALYRNLDFKHTGEQFPVLVYNNSDTIPTIFRRNPHG